MTCRFDAYQPKHLFMSKKLKSRVNGGLAIYFGIGSLISTVLCFIVLILMTYKSVFQTVSYTWGVYLWCAFLIVLFGAMAYALLRIGYEEIEN
jgi:uncharacterized membrane protein YhdT